jgi:hypothetical protein
MWKFLIINFILYAFLLLIVDVYAIQPSIEYTGVITGSVFDEYHVDIPNSTVTLWQNDGLVDIQKNPQQANHGNVTTRIWMDNKTYPYYTSLYRFDRLAPGQYQVTAEMEGHQAFTNVTLDNNTVVVNLTISDYLGTMFDFSTPTALVTAKQTPAMPNPTPAISALITVLIICIVAYYIGNKK